MEGNKYFFIEGSGRDVCVPCDSDQDQFVHVLNSSFGGEVGLGQNYENDHRYQSIVH